MFLIFTDFWFRMVLLNISFMIKFSQHFAIYELLFDDKVIVGHSLIIRYQLKFTFCELWQFCELWKVNIIMFY